MDEAPRPSRGLVVPATLTGTLLWLLYPVAYWIGIGARHAARCADHPFTGHFDSCHNDALPILEMGWSAIAWLLTPLFAWCAWRLWQGARQERPYVGHTAQWTGGIAGCGWCGWNLLSVPPAICNALLFAFWGAFLGWFGWLLLVIYRAARRRGPD